MSRSEAERERLGREVYDAAQWGDLDRLRAAERQGGSLDWKNRNGWTSLMTASVYNRLAVVRYLLSRNVELNAVDSSGRSALHFAARDGSTEVAVALLEAGIDHAIVATRGTAAGKTAQQWAEFNNKSETAAAIASFIAEYTRSPSHVCCSQAPPCKQKQLFFSHLSLFTAKPRAPSKTCDVLEDEAASGDYAR